MNKYVHVNTSGELVSVTTTSGNYQEGMQISFDTTIHRLPLELESMSINWLRDNIIFKDGTFYPVTERPSNYYSWDKTSESWEVSESAKENLKQEKKYLIDLNRNSLGLQTIVYDDKLLDADTQAQANINGKLQEIFAREAANTPLVSGEMFWKDANNVIHSWADQTNYKLWLQGLVIAISSRNTTLYVKAWTKKAEVEALTDINDIINYDVTTGWD